MSRNVQHANSSITTDTSSISSPLPKVIDCQSQSSLLDALVSKCVSEVIFPKKQFVVLEKELESNGKLAEKVLKALNMEQKDWHSIKEVVRRRLNRKRNNIQLCVRKQLMSKLYFKCLFYFMAFSHFFYRTLTEYFKTKSVVVFSPDCVYKLREDEETFEWFIDHIVTVAAGVGHAE